MFFLLGCSVCYRWTEHRFLWKAQAKSKNYLYIIKSKVYWKTKLRLEDRYHVVQCTTLTLLETHVLTKDPRRLTKIEEKNSAHTTNNGEEVKIYFTAHGADYFNLR